MLVNAWWGGSYLGGIDLLGVGYTEFEVVGVSDKQRTRGGAWLG